MRRIREINPSINAFVAVREEDALREAAAADQLREGRGALHGIPVTVKDSLDVAGMATGAGVPSRRTAIAAQDATAVARLRAAGAIILGKTNTPEYISSYETDNFVTGRTNNPWDVTRTPGGSSGGEAAAIATCCSAGGVATDGGGSIRVPAHFCGIAGLKPTPGRIPVRGNFPAISTPAGFVTNPGPMARTVRDVRLLYDVMAGYEAGDPFAMPVQEIPPGAGVRVGVWPAFPGVPVQAEITEAVTRAAQWLGAELFEPAGLEMAPNVWAFLFSAIPAAAWRSQLEGRAGELHWTSAETIGKAMERPPVTLDEVVKTFAQRDRMRAKLLRQMEEFPVILMPVCGVTAFRHRERKFTTGEKQIGLFQAMMPAVAANALGLPALTVPVSVTKEGLPVGVQLVGRPWEEQTLLDIGERLEEARGDFQLP